MKRLGDAAVLALNDLAEAKMSYTRGRASDIAFIRRFRMKDGSVKTNPGFLNPDIDHPLGEPDKRVALAYFKRENAPEIAYVGTTLPRGASLNQETGEFIWKPRFATMSIWLSATTTGAPNSMSCVVKYRFRSRFDASTMSTMTSASPLIR